MLVFAAPAAAGALLSARDVALSAVAAIMFTLCASGGYLLNDALDVESDRVHPSKRFRPVASGRISVPLARLAGTALTVVAVAGGWLLAGWQLAVVLTVYAVVTLAYSAYLKRIPVLELLVVTSGFLLRTLAGAVAVDVPISRWFLIVTGFGSLYLVAGKRHAEVTALGGEGSRHRAVLAAYPALYLRQTRELSASVSLLGYCLWAFSGEAASMPWSILSVIPVTFGMLRYGLILELGKGDAPEEIFLRDGPLIIALAGWLLLFLLSVAKVGA